MSPTNSTWTGPSLIPGRRGEMPATNRLSHERSLRAVVHTYRQNRCRCRRRYRCCHQYNPGLVYTNTDKIGVGPGGDIGGTDISCNLYGQAVHGADRTKLSGRVCTCSAHQSGVFIEGVACITPTWWSS
jgi:hypothetical protein